ncbi:MAG: hypothetical protein VX458_04895 [Bacteroidota bacterium]|nr:hypothetical protein [Bacteroidota bacterium]
MKNLLFVSLGRMIGSILRWIISKNVSGYFGSSFYFLGMRIFK